MYLAVVVLLLIKDWILLPSLHLSSHRVINIFLKDVIVVSPNTWTVILSCRFVVNPFGNYFRLSVLCSSITRADVHAASSKYANSRYWLQSFDRSTQITFQLGTNFGHIKFQHIINFLKIFVKSLCKARIARRSQATSMFAAHFNCINADTHLFSNNSTTSAQPNRTRT